MVLLPDCACCGCSSVCCQLASQFLSATSLEIDIAATDYEISREEVVARLPTVGGLICGKYNIGARGVAFRVFKGSLHNGTYSLPFVSERFVTGYPNGDLERYFLHTINHPPYVCSAKIEVWVLLKATNLISVSPIIFGRELSSVNVQLSMSFISGFERGGTSIPSVVACDAPYQCVGNVEVGNSFGNSSNYHANYWQFPCDSSFSLAGVQGTHDVSSENFGGGTVPFVFGRTSSDEKGTNCGDWVGPPPTPETASFSFSNFVIP